MSVESFVQNGDWLGLARWMGFESRPVRLDGGLAGWGLEMLEGLGVTLLTSPGVRLLMVVGDPSRRTCRAAICAANRRNPADVLLWWWVRPETFEVSFGVGRSDGGVDVRRMVVARGCPEREGLRQLEGLRISGVVSPDERERGRAARRHFEETLNREVVTRAFFDGFRRALDRLMSSMSDGPETTEARHAVALNTLLRVLFLYFLQSRNALNADRRFILRAWRGRPRDQTFYRSTLRPLFFGALNTPEDKRPDEARALGSIPFLNGGLFDPTPDERTHDGLDWSDEVWCEILEGLFERYHFEVTPDQEDESCAIDPEMLGKVFEGLMFGDLRSKSGSFYTPIDVVQKMVRSGLSQHLQERLGWDQNMVDGLWSTSAVDLDTQDALREALTAFRVLDPAVGTGAFLLESLNQLKHLWTLVDGPIDHIRLRELVHEHLHGVDVNYTATRLCELRIWIALLAATPSDKVASMPPLPNLTHRIVTGDALIEPIDLVSRRTRRGTVASSRILRSAKAQRLDALQRKFLTCHGSGKVQLRAALDAAERDLAHDMIKERVKRLEADAEHLARHSVQRDIFGNEIENAGARRAHTRALAEKQSLMSFSHGSSQALMLTWAAKFPTVFQHGGFDMIVTNPPWVRAHNVDKTKLGVLSARYDCAQNGLWKAAKKRGIRVPFGAQVDLANVFVERSIELLKPNGQLVALVPSKMFRSLQGTGIRRVLANTDILSIEDFAESDRNMFDATTYPAILQLRKARTSLSTSVSMWFGEHCQSWSQTLPKDGRPWALLPPDIGRILEKMLSRSDHHLEPMRGIFTGANDVFVGTREDLATTLGLPDDSGLLRPVLRGSDIDGRQEVIFWPYDDAGKMVTIPDSCKAYFDRHSTRLRARTDYDPGEQPWQLFRVRADTTSPKVVWRDIALELCARASPQGSVPLNTVYYIPCEDERHAEQLARLMNTTPIRAAARMYSERARGGYRRHFAWCVRMLPMTAKLLERAKAGHEITSDLVAEDLGLDREDLQALEAWLKPDRDDAVFAA